MSKAANKKNKKIIISGFGGQGVLLLGKLIAEAALIQELNTTWMPSYGPEMRGGTCNCTVQYAAGDISAPVVDQPDILIAMNEPSLDKFGPRVKPGGIIITNSNIVLKQCDRTDVKIYEIPMEEIAREANNKKGPNIVGLGAFVKLVGDIKEASACEAIKMTFSAPDKIKFVDSNIKCLKQGIKVAGKL